MPGRLMVALSLPHQAETEILVLLRSAVRISVRDGSSQHASHCSASQLARLPFAIMKAGPPTFFGLTDVFVLACVLYDLITLKRIHRS